MPYICPYFIRMIRGYLYLGLLLFIIAACADEPAHPYSDKTEQTQPKETSRQNEENKGFKEKQEISDLKAQKVGPEEKNLSQPNETANDVYGFAPSRDKLENRLIEEFANIDPLEYYLYREPKFTDGALMRKKKEELARLNRKYKACFNEKGQLQDKRNNNAILVSLVNNTFPDLYPPRDSSNKNNNGIVDIKRGVFNTPIKSLLNEAVVQIYEVKFEEAERQLLNMLHDDDDNAYLVNYNLAYLRFRAKDYPNAIGYAKIAVQLRKDFYLAYLLMGDAYLAIGSFEKAGLLYEKSLSIKENVVGLERVGFTSIVMNNGARAQQCYRRIFEIYSNDDRSLYTAYMAIAHALKGEYKQAKKKAKALIAMHKDRYLPYLALAYTELMQGEFKNATEAFEAAGTRGQLMYADLGKALTAYYAKDYATAVKMFYHLDAEPSFNKFSKFPVLTGIRGFALANNNNYTAAAQKFKEYGELHPKDVCYYLGMSICAYDREEFVLAEAMLDSTEFQSENPADYYYLKGLYALRNEHYKSAKNNFEKSLKIRVHNRTINGLGSALNGMDEYEKAIKVFNRGLKTNQNDAYLLFNKATAIFNIGKRLYEEGQDSIARDTVATACNLMHSAASIDRKFIIDMNIGNGYMGLKDSATAMRYYNKVSHLAAEVNKAVVYAEMDMKDRARELLEKVKQAEPRLELAEYNLSVLDKPGRRRGTIYRYYQFYYFEPYYNWKPDVPVCIPEVFEPLPPLGECKLEFESLASD